MHDGEFRSQNEDLSDGTRSGCPARSNLRWSARLHLKAGASAETVGAKQVGLNVLPMPPGARAKVHFHEGVETIAYLLEGECAVYYGDDVECRVELRKGDQIFLPANVPHAPSNEGDEPCTWIVVHASGSDQEGIVLLPALDAVLAAR